MWSWNIVGSICGILITLGVAITLGGAMMNLPYEYTLARISYTLAFSIFLARIGYWLAFERPENVSWVTRLFITGIIFGSVGILWVGSVIWLAEREHRQTARTNAPAYKIGARCAIISDNPGKLTLFMVGYKTGFGDTASPVFYLINIAIMNLQNIASTIEGYSVAVGDTEKGPWQNLMPISLLSNNLYALGKKNTGTGSIGFPRGVYRLGTAMTQKDLTHAALLDPFPKLENELKKPIGSSQTVGGWAAFDLKDCTIRKIQDFMRITLRDSAGKSFSEVISIPRQQSDSEIDTQVGLINVIGPIINMSSFHVQYYRDPINAKKKD
jgi:hypothetical protein